MMMHCRPVTRFIAADLSSQGTRYTHTITDSNGESGEETTQKGEREREWTIG